MTTEDKFWPEVNGQLDMEAAKAQYAFQRRVQVRDFLSESTAERIHECLMTETPWGFAYMDGAEQRMMHRRELESITRARADRIAKTITTQAGEQQFSYGYFCYPMLDAALQGWNPELVLHDVIEFMNSPKMLDIVRSVTGKGNLIKADAQATLYSHQHFLTTHDDTGDGDRRVAYVLNLTKDWREDWGGYLHFYNKDGDIIQGFKPRFNSLTLFDVPQRHAVSYVPPYAAIGRLAISGWFRDK